MWATSISRVHKFYFAFTFRYLVTASSGCCLKKSSTSAASASLLKLRATPLTRLVSRVPLVYWLVNSWKFFLKKDHAVDEVPG